MAAALYRREDQQAACNPFVAAILKSSKADLVEVWPDNLPTFVLFDRMCTQWRSQGMSGPVVGLDYNVLFRFLDRMGLKDSDCDQMLNDISVMEQAALAEIHSGTS